MELNHDMSLIKSIKNTKIASKVWVFWEGHKIWKNLRRTFDKSFMFCVRNSVLVKKLMNIFQNKYGQAVHYHLQVEPNPKKIVH